MSGKTFFEPVRVGVVGTGRFAVRTHLGSLQTDNGASLIAIADSDRERAKVVAKRFDGVHAFTDALSLFRSGLVEAVVISTPHDSHAVLAREALDCGLHVLVEKPLTLTADSAWALVDLAAERGLTLAVGHTYQMTAAATRAREVIASGGLGRVLQVSVTLDSATRELLAGVRRGTNGQDGGEPTTTTYADPAKGGGQAFGQTVHGLGMALFVLDEPATQVMALFENDGLAVDVANGILVRLESGAIVVVSSVSRPESAAGDYKVLRYYGSRGVCTHDLVQGHLEISTGGGTERLRLRQRDALPSTETVRHFVRVVRGQAANVLPGDIAARTVGILEAAHRSAAERRVVSLDPVR